MSCTSEEVMMGFLGKATHSLVEKGLQVAIVLCL